MVRYVINVKDGTKIPYTAEEEASDDKEKNDARVPLKLGQIRVERDSKLKETDVWVLKGTITDEQKTYREICLKFNTTPYFIEKEGSPTQDFSHE